VIGVGIAVIDLHPAAHRVISAWNGGRLTLRPKTAWHAAQGHLHDELPKRYIDTVRGRCRT
jgi:hypothetical protein